MSGPIIGRVHERDFVPHKAYKNALLAATQTAVAAVVRRLSADGH